MTEAPHGAFIVVGMADYDHHDDLDHVKRVVPDLCAALASCKLTQHLPALARGGTFLEVVGALSAPLRDRPTSLVLYWTGHGVHLPHGDFLLVKNSPPERGLGPFNAVNARDLASNLAVWQVREAIVIIDACYSGTSALEVADLLFRAIKEQTFPDGDPNVSIIASCGPFDRVQDGHFAERFVSIVRNGGTSRDWAPGNEYVYPFQVIEEINKEADHLGLSRASHISYGSPPRLIPNPKAMVLPTDDVHTQARRQQRILDTGLRDHFRRAASGIEVDSTGWFFVGRTRILSTLLTWLDADRAYGLRVITGKPGSGKSAVLGRIATLSHPAYRELAEQEGALEGAAPGTIPREGLIDVALHARNKSLHDCWDLLSSGLDIPPPPDGWRSSAELIDRITALHRPVRIIIDALDEARRDAILAIATDLIRPLGQQQDIRVLVGTRPNAPWMTTPTAPGRGPLTTLLAPDAHHTVVLDTDPHTQQDIEQYVTRRLTRTPNSPYRSAPHPTIEATAQAVAEASAGVFLFARIVTRALLARTTPLRLGTEEASQMLSGEVADVFAADLARFGEDEGKVRELLSPLAWAEGAGFPRHLIWPTVATALSPTGTQYTTADIDWLLDIAGYHVSESSEDGQAVYRLYHQAFADYFRALATRIP
ncbi:ATP-binding protein [Sphaerisporangium sp. B11E5]|uniref:ATP-binding protein n=1 Tax=Sphaerisporangium sp. B11E5 TaxID=3153563 RepID=UPI00325E93EB